MLRWLFTIFMVFNFASYVFAHGSCSYSDSDIAKCETIKNQHSVCEQTNTPTKSASPQKTDEAFHICGCVSLFIQRDAVQSFEFDQLVEFTIVGKFMINDEFYRRIERPPIKRT